MTFDEILKLSRAVPFEGNRIQIRPLTTPLTQHVQHRSTMMYRVRQNVHDRLTTREMEDLVLHAPGIR